MLKDFLVIHLTKLLDVDVAAELHAFISYWSDIIQQALFQPRTQILRTKFGILSFWDKVLNKWTIFSIFYIKKLNIIFPVIFSHNNWSLQAWIFQVWFIDSLSEGSLADLIRIGAHSFSYHGDFPIWSISILELKRCLQKGNFDNYDCLKNCLYHQPNSPSEI